VHTVLAGSQYREQAQRLRKNFSRYDALAEIARSVNTLIADTKDSRMTDAPHPTV
jgi:UDP:flavonoid glycosyltransferase YjiC (YdhE family)